MEETTHIPARLGYSIMSAVEATGIGRSKLYEAMAAGDLKARKSGRRTVIRAADLESFINGLPAMTSPRSPASTRH
jgi:hypothetical protein